MKNLYLLPTDKASKLTLLHETRLLFSKEDCEVSKTKRCVNQNIYITNDEEIKEGGWCIMTNDFNDNYIVKVIALKCIGGKEIRVQLLLNGKENTPLLEKCEKIILTTDQDLIKDGVQAIDNEFLEWFVKNPSCESVEVENKKLFDGFLDPEYGSSKWRFNYKIIIPKEEPKQDLEKEMFDLEQELDIPSNLRFHNSKPKEETLEEAAINRSNKIVDLGDNFQSGFCQGFIQGAKWQQERMYSEKKLKEILIKYHHYLTTDDDIDANKWFEQFKKK
jgi:hypothetical protein